MQAELKRLPCWPLHKDRAGLLGHLNVPLQDGARTLRVSMSSLPVYCKTLVLCLNAEGLISLPQHARGPTMQTMLLQAPIIWGDPQCWMEQEPERSTGRRSKAWGSCPDGLLNIFKMQIAPSSCPSEGSMYGAH